MGTVDYFLTLDAYSGGPVAGESQDAKYKGAIDILTFSYEIDQTINIGSATSGAGAGKVSFHPFVVTKYFDKSSPVLFACCCSGTPFKQASMIIRKAGKEQQPYLKFEFKLVAISSIKYIESANSLPIEQINFEFGGMQVSYCEQKADGTLAAATVKGWDRVKNVAM